MDNIKRHLIYLKNIIINIFTKQDYTMDIVGECPICFDYIEDNDGILIMDCCEKKIHIRCLVEWYTNNPNKMVCIMCNQNNSFSNTFIYNF